ncbi:MAG: prolipoprotein diacylglyceryl transferase [Paracoccaceae bacterium]|jgi:phosphatidylglycerol:prolipoprotein diacylglycerol transferase|nr:prolipoprotein diacylglyceryl transferase [Paracoccaceae bacterium]MDA0318991.1 prolipoprotein diacylglyceryl transferase [Pseudomonadota bacterium]MDA0851923.1 prolipoprotein diacylglyceryl transferase [Pseudomonadota bacterium]MDA1295923.1 prolipoprotein diacylglyceryl transferase [Pseudomonadota bacterium]NCW14932.1 prolipoprotein diacylglyceryl transferase [Paracoccaceae bacterium]
MILFPEISPEIFSVDIGGFEFALRWYALSYIIGIFLGWRLAVLATRRADLWPRNQSPLEPVQAEDLMTWIVFGVILGGRLGYVIFYEPSKYIGDPVSILKVWQGGMSFHGGFLGVVFTAYLFFKRNHVPYASGADLLALCTPIGLLLGRIANFINAELWGRATEMPWGVAFPGEAAQACGQLSGLCARHPSQLYEAVLEGLLLGMILIFVAFRKNGLKRPGLISGLFFAGYGIARYMVEFFRQPDAQFQSVTNPVGYAFQFGDYGLTMGQSLSLPMIILGIALIITALRRAAL